MQKLEKAKAELVNLYNKCYSNASNDEFDKYQPDILCQIDCINAGDVDEEDLNDIINMVESLKSEWRRCSAKVEIQWVYG